MLQYLQKRLPEEWVKPVQQICMRNSHPTQKVRQFCSNYKIHPSSLKHFTVQELVDDPDLWLVSSNESKKRQKYLKEIYPKHVKQDIDMQPSILQCGRCKKNTVDYYEKQTRGADEPMTCFASVYHAAIDGVNNINPCICKH